MGSRGPISKRQAQTVRTAEGKKLRRLPDHVDAIFRRLARDLPGVTEADVALIEDMARWAHIGQEAYRQLVELAKPVATVEEAVDPVLELLTTDTTHGNKEESRKSPLLIVLRTASEQLRADAQQLGGSPMARARLPIEELEQLSLAEVLFGDVTKANANRE